MLTPITSLNLDAAILGLCSSVRLPGILTCYNPRDDTPVAFMHCPYCHEPETRVVDSRLISEGAQIRRRRECIKCQERFTTFESAELLMPVIMKRDGRRSPFDEKKLRSGLLKALEKRPISAEQVEAAVTHIQHQLVATGEREVPSKLLGELVMNELRQLDDIAFIRFASVYLRFQDVKEFHDVIEKLYAKNQ